MPHDERPVEQRSLDEVVVDALPVSVVVLAADGTVVRANEAAGAVFGPQAVAVGQRFETSVDVRLPVSAETLAAVVSSGEQRTEVAYVDNHDGSGVWLDVSLRPVVTAGEHLVMLVAVDVTEPKSAQDAVKGAAAVRRQLIDRLDRANDALRRSNGELERFAGAIAHDLKAPLSTIRGFAELLPDMFDPADADAQLATGRILYNVDRANRMVRDLLAYARAVGTVGARERVDTAAACRWAADMLRQRIADAEATVTVGAIEPVFANTTALRHVVLNVLDNALKYRRPDVAPVIDCSGQSDGAHVEIRITDNGRGIPPEWRDEVLVLGKRFVPAGADNPDGSGFGLTSCAVVIAELGGRISIQDREDGGPGVSVVIELPHASAEPETSGAAVRTVMVIDDDPDVAEMIRLAADEVGIQLVASAGTGRDGLAQYELLIEPPAVIVLDHQLPDALGTDIAEQLRRLRPHQRIILHTSHLDEVETHSSAVDEQVPKGEIGALLDALRRTTSEVIATEHP